MKAFKMKWPALNLEVICEEIEYNQAALNVLISNMPIKALQGHEMVGGRILRDRSLQLARSPFEPEKLSLEEKKMDELPVGAVVLLSPFGSAAELLVKYDDSVDDRKYIPIAKVRKQDLDTLVKAGKQVWRSATREQKKIIVEFTEVE